MKLFYELGYRHFTMPWEGGPRSELMQLVESGRLKPGRAVDLGCGSGANAVYLAEHGFEVTGVDFAASALEKAELLAKAHNARVKWVQDDLTHLTHLTGQFDVLVDYGVLDDLGGRDRDRYVEQVTPLARVGGQFLLWCFEWRLRWWERAFPMAMAMAPGEVELRFGGGFDMEKLAGGLDWSTFPPGFATYLMTRR
ncbi:MAG TPA: methyltransferase domain-containing protein [Candidatus Dormibacteraeota bacterium]|nr:methyltransferase domain-containing protein [Candidatus Dormibacteraeota bacterium]